MRGYCLLDFDIGGTLVCTQPFCLARLGPDYLPDRAVDWFITQLRDVCGSFFVDTIKAGAPLDQWHHLYGGTELDVIPPRDQSKQTSLDLDRYMDINGCMEPPRNLEANKPYLRRHGTATDTT